MSRESSKESSSSDELDRASNFTSSSEVNPNPNPAIIVARGMSTPPVSKTSSPAAMKRAKMMVKSYSQDACGVGNAAASTATPVTTASSVINVPVTTPHMTTSVSEGHLQQQSAAAALAKQRASNSPSLSSSRSGSSLAGGSKGAELGTAGAAGGSKPSIVEELDESCSASDSGSMTDLSGKKKKKSFFHFKRKKEKKVEM